MSACILTVLALCQLTLAQFVSPPTNFTSKQGHANVTVRYKQVPAGICEQDPNVKSYSGYADVSENEHIFWWFFEARNIDPSTAPLTVWINGGPGSSSMIGLFQELGPCTVNSDGVAVENPYSWSNVSNMLFIDQPTQTGFSYSVPVPGYIEPFSNNGDIVVLPNNTCPDYASDWDCGTYSLPDVTLTANSTPGAAPNFYLTLQGFMGAFPEYSRNGFYFATESYGGHYGPIFNQYFLDQNKLNKSGTVQIDLKAVLIGNGWFDPIIQYEAYYTFAVNNTYDIQIYNSSWQEQVFNNMYGAGNCFDMLQKCANTSTDDTCSTADAFCYAQVEDLFDISSGRDEYDSRYLTPDPFPPTFYVDYLNSPDVQAAIGAYVNFTEGSSTVYNAFVVTGDDARVWDIPSVVGNLVEENITVVLYFGDADFNCNWFGGTALLPLITPQPAGFSTAGFTPVLSGSSTAEKPRGEVRQSSNFAFMRIYESGHEVPFYQPELALTMLNRTIHGVDLATGLEKQVGVLTQGPMTSTYREGNSTVQYDVVPTDATYDWETSLPVLPGNSTGNSTMGELKMKLKLNARDTKEKKEKKAKIPRSLGGKRHPRRNQRVQV